jgi:hypothetical protein
MKPSLNCQTDHKFLLYFENKDYIFFKKLVVQISEIFILTLFMTDFYKFSQVQIMGTRQLTDV